MAMSSLHADRQAARREFAQVRELRDQIAGEFGGRVDLHELSMGMSGDYTEAIAEGATMVRIGSSLWEGILDAGVSERPTPHAIFTPRAVRYQAYRALQSTEPCRVQSPAEYRVL